MTDTRTDEQKVKDIEKAHTYLLQIRQPYEEMVDNVIRFVHHSKRKITDTDLMRGRKTGIDIYDGTALSASNLAVDGICGYSFSKSYRWFEYTLPNKLNFPVWSGMRAWTGKRMDEIDEVKRWLEDCEEVMYGAYLRSNFYDIAPSIVKDAITIGTPHGYIEEELASGRIIIDNPHFREVCIAENRFGQVDTHYREFKYTLRQLKDKFGIEVMAKADSTFKQKYEQNPYQEMTVIHAIYPRSDYDLSNLNSKSKPIASMWVLKGTGQGKKRLLLESGYDESPVFSWRWWKNNDEIYGRSPSWDAYVMIALANQEAKTNLIAAHKMVDQPLIATEDLRGKIMNAPGATTFVGRDLPPDRYPKPLNTGITLPFAVEQQDRTERIIRDFYSVDFFLMLAQAAQNKVELTATQVIEMAGEKAAVLGTKIGRMETEFLNPLHDKIFAIEAKRENGGRGSRIPQPPQILIDYINTQPAGTHIEIDYLGPLAQLQKSIGKSKALRAGIQLVGETANYFPQVAQVIDPIKTIRDILDSIGFPMKDTRTDEEIEAILAQKQRIEDADKSIAQGVEIAKAGSRLTKTIEPGSPLEALLGTGGKGEA